MIEKSESSIEDRLRRMYLGTFHITGDRTMLAGWSSYYDKDGGIKTERVLLSIGPKGDVKYWSQEVDSNFDYIPNAKLTNASLRINFPK